ncbi:unnamed protein product, partial [Chrysoparadoxa australica]
MLIDIHLAASRGAIADVQAYVEKGGDLELRGLHSFTPLHSAADKGQTEASEVLLKAGASVIAGDKRGNTPLHRAVMNGHVECAKVLLAFHADPTAKNHAGLACKDRFERAVPQPTRNLLMQILAEALESRKEEFEARAESMAEANVFESIRTGDMAAVERFIAGGGDVNKKDQLSDTPLHIASRWGNMDALRYLIANKASVTSVNKNGQTPLHIAAMWGQLEACKALVQSKSPFDVQDTQSGRYPLHAACAHGHREVVLLLLGCHKRAGICDELDAVDNLLATPLHLAAEAAHKRCVDVLLKNGANPWLKNKDGHLAGEVFVGGSQASMKRAILISLQKARESQQPPGTEAIADVKEYNKLVRLASSSKTLDSPDERTNGGAAEVAAPEAVNYEEEEVLVPDRWS